MILLLLVYFGALMPICVVELVAALGAWLFSAATGRGICWSAGGCHFCRQAVTLY